jgi:hypothetical protein
MANHRIPRRNTQRVEEFHGIDAGGDVVTVAVFRHVREGHAEPEFYLVGYREAARRIDRASRVTQQFSGPRAAERLEAELAVSRALMADSRVAEAERVARVTAGQGV